MGQYDWEYYYKTAFSYFPAANIRPGCGPRQLLQPGARADRAIVLVHGLSDSPYYMMAIAKFFHAELKYDVYLPLLHFHGLSNIATMEGVALAEWKRNVGHALKQAKTRTDDISIGGLSTGGALSFREVASKNPLVTGDLFLFSAALTLVGTLGRVITGQVAVDLTGNMEEWILRKQRKIIEKITGRVADVGIQGKLVGAQPYRYDFIDTHAAIQLALLIDENDQLAATYSHANPFPKRVFAAHSEADETAHIDGVEDLESRCWPDMFQFYRIPRAAKVSHPGLVLDQPIEVEKNGRLERMQDHNPQFATMMQAVRRFVASRP